MMCVVNYADLVTDFSSSSPGDLSAETARLENGWDEDTVTWKQLDSSWTSWGLYLEQNKYSQMVSNGKRVVWSMFMFMDKHLNFRLVTSPKESNPPHGLESDPELGLVPAVVLGLHVVQREEAVQRELALLQREVGHHHGPLLVRHLLAARAPVEKIELGPGKQNVKLPTERLSFLDPIGSLVSTL